MHHSPLFWLGLGLCLAAIATYVLTGREFTHQVGNR
jgi:hypothetical protein